MIDGLKWYRPKPCHYDSGNFSRVILIDISHEISLQIIKIVRQERKSHEENRRRCRHPSKFY